MIWLILKMATAVVAAQVAASKIVWLATNAPRRTMMASKKRRRVARLLGKMSNSNGNSVKQSNSVIVRPKATTLPSWRNGGEVTKFKHKNETIVVTTHRTTGHAFQATARATASSRVAP